MRCGFLNARFQIGDKKATIDNSQESLPEPETKTEPLNESLTVPEKKLEELKESPEIVLQESKITELDDHDQPIPLEPTPPEPTPKREGRRKKRAK
jgi:hypothetical protein